MKYFITKRLLNSQQARWADIVTDYNFKITYCSGTANIVADTLTRKHSELITQKEKDIAARTQLFLELNCVIVSVEEGSEKQTELTENPYQLIDQILQANWTHDSLNQYYQTAKKEEQRWKLQDDLLIHFEKLMIPDVNALQTHLINKTHSTSVTAHSGKTKTAKLLSAQYYWSDLLNNCSTFISNCWTCRWTHVLWDKTSDLLHSLLIEDKCWQHILFNFKFFPLNKKGFDNIFVIVNCFEKRAFSLPCKKTVTVAQAA